MSTQRGTLHSFRQVRGVRPKPVHRSCRIRANAHDSWRVAAPRCGPALTLQLLLLLLLEALLPCCSKHKRRRVRTGGAGPCKAAIVAIADVNRGPAAAQGPLDLGNLIDLVTQSRHCITCMHAFLHCPLLTSCFTS